MQLIRKSCAGLAVGALLVAMASTSSASAATLKVRVGDRAIKKGGMIPTKYAFCMAAAQGHIAPGPDISPMISWSKGPKGTQSYAVIVTDTNSPKTDREKMNKEGMTVPKTATRQTFFHMALVDIPANVRSLKEGPCPTPASCTASRRRRPRSGCLASWTSLKSSPPTTR